MQLHITVSIPEDKPIELPIGNHHILQSILYKSMSGMQEVTDFLHNVGFQKGKQNFKLFTFSELKGKYRVENKRITYFEKVDWEIRSVEPLVLHVIMQAVMSNGIQFGKEVYTDISCDLSDDTIEEESILIKLRTPIIVYQTDCETNKTSFKYPDEEEFYKLVQSNFRHKYYSYSKIKPDEDIELIPIQIYENDFVSTQYKTTYIKGYKGVYRLKGKRKYLDFLYQTGLGTKNSQGFGIFDILK